MHNQTHTFSAPHYKTHFQFLRKLKDFYCALWSEKKNSIHKVMHNQNGSGGYKFQLVGLVFLYSFQTFPLGDRFRG